MANGDQNVTVMKAQPGGRPLEPIEPVVDANAERSSIAQSNKLFRQAGYAAVGDRVGPSPYPGWTQRNVGGVTVYTQPDEGDPQHKIRIWNPNVTQNPPTDSHWLGGDTYGQELADLRHWASGQAGATTGLGAQVAKDWSKATGVTDPSMGNYGQLRAYQRFMQRYGDWQMPTDGPQITQANQTVGLLRDIETQYATLKGKEGLDKFKQMGQDLKTQGVDPATMANNILTGQYITGKDPQRDAYLRMMRDVMQLQNQGVNVAHLGKSVAGPLVDTVNDVLSGPAGILKPLVSAGIGGALDLVKQTLDGNFDPDALRFNVPYQKLVLDQNLYNTIHNGVGQRIFYNQDQREIGEAARKEMVANGMDSSSTPADVATPIPEPTEQSDKTTTPPKSGVGAGSGAQAGAGQSPIAQQPSTPVWRPQQNPLNTAIDQGLRSVVNLATGGGLATPQQGSQQKDITKVIPKGPPYAPIDQLANTVGSNVAKAVSPPAPDATQQAVEQRQIIPAEADAIRKARQSAPAPPREVAGPMPAPLGPQVIQTPQIVPQSVTEAEPVAEDVAVGSYANNAPHVHHQEMVDTMRPGSVFRWRDHPHLYVKV